MRHLASYRNSPRAIKVDRRPVRRANWGELGGTAALPLLFFLFRWYRVTRTEEILLAAFCVLFWNQVIQANQLLFSASGLLIFGPSRGRVFFVLRRAHVGLSVISIRANIRKC